ncbi:MAG TPA: DUF1223 domain-containing protein [Albitalea sp.]|uniref:DUF1223 domain-containing protein n=1 Tax=Piscinibacter sp. TaxID=1903157 RepID=UPI002ED65494
MNRRLTPWPRAAAAAGAAAMLGAQALAAPACTARSGPTMAPVIELYTSEGCNSCPPADRWLSALKDRADVVGLAFHVDYWDRLGWKDRFARPGFTQRQSEQQAVNGARFSYTPQVVLDGHDRKDWPRIALGAVRPAAPVQIELTREADAVVARVTPLGQAPRQLAAYWAVTEFGHRTAVKAGENEGVTLEHDFVVTDYRREAAWAAATGATRSLSFAPGAPSDASRMRKVNLVVVDASTGRPVQALALACS